MDSNGVERRKPRVKLKKPENTESRKNTKTTFSWSESFVQRPASFTTCACSWPKKLSLQTSPERLKIPVQQEASWQRDEWQAAPVQFSSVQFGSVRFSSVCQEFSFTSRCQLFSIPVFGDWLWSRGQEIVAAGRVAYSTLLLVRGSVSSAASKEKRLSKDLFIPSPTIFVVIFGLCVVRFSFAALLPAFCLPGKLCLFAFGHT